MHFTIESDESPLRSDDKLEVAEDIRRGDIVWFDRITPTQVVLRVVPPDRVASFPHPKWRIDGGSARGSLKLSLLESFKENV